MENKVTPEERSVLSQYMGAIESLEEKLILDSKFGDRVDDEIRDKARLIIVMWDKYMGLNGANSGRNIYYAAPHIYALGSWLEGSMDYGQMWAILQNKTTRNLSEEDAKKVEHFRKEYGHSS